MSDFNTPISFVMLLDDCQRVVIPKIQRDYAQGRDEEAEVRNAFLDALQAALLLPTGDARLPLNLDFIYGSMEGRDAQSFLPLDGQQRLTTLFLLHWYLAWRDDRLAEFHSTTWQGTHSRFSYGVRPSSTEFFDALVQFRPAATPPEVCSVRALLEDQAWYFLYWRLDPTIQSALTMLDAIHERFRSSADLYRRLIDREQPAVTFQLLRLEHFGLSDDLYIKMNARGKPLTSFETFKARFEELLKTLYPTETRKIDDTEFSVPQFFERRMDTQWTDFFWQYKNPTSQTFDDSVMNLVWALIRVSLNPAEPLFNDHTAMLRTRQIISSYQAFHERGWLTRSLADNLICILEVWSAGGSKLTRQLQDKFYFDEAAFFAKAIANPTGLDYSELARFAGLVIYLHLHKGAVEPAELQEWMRVVFNLVENSNIERPEEFGRSLAALRRLAPEGPRILSALAAGNAEASGFSIQQVREEVLKAKLLLADAGWRTRLEVAERHGYFRGQIEFLLEFAGITSLAAQIPVGDWQPKQHVDLQAKFDDLLGKAQRTFGPNGLKEFSESTHLWQCALLTVGDYLIDGNTNTSFGTDSTGQWDSWKRYLRGNSAGESPSRRYLLTLWNKLNVDKPLAPQLQQFIDQSTDLEPWRAALVKYPQIMDYGEQRLLRRRTGVPEIYLLKKIQMTGAHAELFSYALYLELKNISGKAEIAPLTVSGYESVTMTEKEPSLLLSFYRTPATLKFQVESYANAFRIYTKRAPLAALSGAEALLTDSLGFAISPESLSRTAARSDVVAVLRQLGQGLDRLPLSSPPISTTSN